MHGDPLSEAVITVARSVTRGIASAHPPSFARPSRFDKNLVADKQAASKDMGKGIEDRGSAPADGPKYLAASWESSSVPVEVLGMRRLARKDSSDGSNSNGSDSDGQNHSNSKDGDTEEDSSNNMDDSTEMLLIIWIVVGCGIVTLVVLCIVRKVGSSCGMAAGSRLRREGGDFCCFAPEGAHPLLLHCFALWSRLRLAGRESCV